MFSDYPWPLWLCIDVCAFEEVVIFSSVYRLALTGKALYQSTWPGFWAGCLIGICTGACCWSQAGWPGACVSGWVGLLPGHTRMGLNLGLQGGLGAWDCSVRPRSWVHRGQPGKWATVACLALGWAWSLGAGSWAWSSAGFYSWGHRCRSGAVIKLGVYTSLSLPHNKGHFSPHCIVQAWDWGDVGNVKLPFLFSSLNLFLFLYFSQVL